ncbi:MAG: hypothetical protein AAF497_07945 [Planctomycetota bacterium]
MQLLRYVEQSVQLVTGRAPARFHDHRESTELVNEVWVHSKCRFRQWQETALALERGVRGPEEYHIDLWNHHLFDVSQLCVAHTFTAIWSAWQVTHNPEVWDHNPALKSNFGDCCVIRQRMGESVANAVEKNSTRRYRIQNVDDLASLYRSSRKWLDLLLGFLNADADVARFGFKPKLVEKNTFDIIKLRRNNPDALRRLGSQVRVDAQRLLQRLDVQDSEDNEVNRSIYDAMIALTTKAPTVVT